MAKTLTRLDQELVARGLCESRERAKSAVMAGVKDTGLAFKQDNGFTDYRKMIEHEVATNISGDPAGGAVEPSMSAGRTGP